MRRSGEQREAADPSVPRGFLDALSAGGGDSTGEAGVARRRDSGSPCCSRANLSVSNGDTPAGHCRRCGPGGAPHDRAYSQFLREWCAAGGGATRLHPRETIAPLWLPRPGPPQDA